MNQAWRWRRRNNRLTLLMLRDQEDMQVRRDIRAISRIIFGGKTWHPRNRKATVAWIEAGKPPF